MMRPVRITRAIGQLEPQAIQPAEPTTGGDGPAILPSIPGLTGISEAVIQQAVAVAIQHAWPEIREHIRADIPYLLEDARPYVAKEINRAALMMGGITLAAVAGTAAAVYFIVRK